MKTLKFADNLVPLVLSREKTSTWRLFDDKDLKVGDDVSLLNKKTLQEFGMARITAVKEKLLGEINESDFDGHEKFENREKMIETYRSYYGDRVNEKTIVKMIDFELLPRQELSIFDKARQLNLPLGEYVIVGGAMEAHGIRKANDIDVVVTPALFNKLIERGWKVCECDKCEEMRQAGTKKRILKSEGVDILSEYSWYDKYYADTETLIRGAEIIDGIPFVQLDELMKWKKAANREKDKKDLILIEQFLRDQK